MRAGVHTGECELRDGDIAGMAVHIGARVSAAPDPARYSSQAPSRILSSAPDSVSKNVAPPNSGESGRVASIRARQELIWSLRAPRRRRLRHHPSYRLTVRPATNPSPEVISSSTCLGTAVSVVMTMAARPPLPLSASS